jgi:hypothetical protein
MLIDGIAIWDYIRHRTKALPLLPKNIPSLHQGKGHAGARNDDPSYLPATCYRPH